MKIFIWSGNRISEAYHDDGTLVVAAETEEQAREVALAARKEYHRKLHIWEAQRDHALAQRGGMSLVDFWNSPAGQELWTQSPKEPWDGDLHAVDRPPDEVVELDRPKVVAFNGGGYD